MQRRRALGAGRRAALAASEALARSLRADDGAAPAASMLVPRLHVLAAAARRGGASWAASCARTAPRSSLPSLPLARSLSAARRAAPSTPEVASDTPWWMSREAFEGPDGVQYRGGGGGEERVAESLGYVDSDDEEDGLDDDAGAFDSDDEGDLSDDDQAGAAGGSGGEARPRGEGALYEEEVWTVDVPMKRDRQRHLLEHRSRVASAQGDQALVDTASLDSTGVPSSLTWVDAVAEHMIRWPNHATVHKKLWKTGLLHESRRGEPEQREALLAALPAEPKYREYYEGLVSQCDVGGPTMHLRHLKQRQFVGALLKLDADTVAVVDGGGGEHSSIIAMSVEVGRLLDLYDLKWSLYLWRNVLDVPGLSRAQEHALRLRDPAGEIAKGAPEQRELATEILHATSAEEVERVVSKRWMLFRVKKWRDALSKKLPAWQRAVVARLASEGRLGVRAVDDCEDDRVRDAAVAILEVSRARGERVRKIMLQHLPAAAWTEAKIDTLCRVLPAREAELVRELDVNGPTWHIKDLAVRRVAQAVLRCEDGDEVDDILLDGDEISWEMWLQEPNKYDAVAAVVPIAGADDGERYASHMERLAAHDPRGAGSGIKAREVRSFLQAVISRDEQERALVLENDSPSGSVSAKWLEDPTDPTVQDMRFFPAEFWEADLDTFLRCVPAHLSGYCRRLDLAGRVRRLRDDNLLELMDYVLGDPPKQDLERVLSLSHKRVKWTRRALDAALTILSPEQSRTLRLAIQEGPAGDRRVAELANCLEQMGGAAAVADVEELVRGDYADVEWTERAARHLRALLSDASLRQAVVEMDLGGPMGGIADPHLRAAVRAVRASADGAAAGAALLASQSPLTPSSLLTAMRHISGLQCLALLETPELRHLIEAEHHSTAIERICGDSEPMVAHTVLIDMGKLGLAPTPEARAAVAVAYSVQDCGDRDPELAISLAMGMLASGKPSARATIAGVADNLENRAEALALSDGLASAGLELDDVDRNAVLRLYARLHDADSVDALLAAAESARQPPDVVTMNALVASACQHGDLTRASALVRSMKAAGPTGGTFAPIAGHYVRAGQMGKAVGVVDGVRALGLDTLPPLAACVAECSDADQSAFFLDAMRSEGLDLGSPVARRALAVAACRVDDMPRATEHFEELVVDTETAPDKALIELLAEGYGRNGFKSEEEALLLRWAKSGGANGVSGGGAADANVLSSEGYSVGAHS